MSWWDRNAAAKSPGTSSAEFYDSCYQAATAQAAPTSDVRTGEVHTPAPDRPSVGYPLGRPASS
ncbi:hypothetical protein [Kitasatospora griseola]|uniref:hypothetical protein n=1 Tax=Kitasatospora griseola TaxID=2064 RepID=UPI0037FC5CBA